MTDKPPAYQHYARDWLVDTAHLSLEQQGAYMRLLDHQWIEGPLSLDETDLARRLVVSAPEFAVLWTRLKAFFPIRPDGRIANVRLERVRNAAETFRKQQSRAGKTGAEARWAKMAVRANPAQIPRKSPDGTENPAPETNDTPTVNGGRIVPPMAIAQPEHASASASASVLTTKKKLPTPPTATWLTPFLDTWKAHLDAYPTNVGLLGKLLKPFASNGDGPKTLLRWANFVVGLKHTPTFFGTEAKQFHKFAGTPAMYDDPDWWMSGYDKREADKLTEGLFG